MVQKLARTQNRTRPRHPKRSLCTVVPAPHHLRASQTRPSRHHMTCCPTRLPVRSRLTAILLHFHMDGVLVIATTRDTGATTAALGDCALNALPCAQSSSTTCHAVTRSSEPVTDDQWPTATRASSIMHVGHSTRHACCSSIQLSAAVAVCAAHPGIQHIYLDPTTPRTSREFVPLACDNRAATLNHIEHADGGINCKKIRRSTVHHDHCTASGGTSSDHLHPTPETVPVLQAEKWWSHRLRSQQKPKARH